MNIKTILQHYLICALWVSTDDNGNPFDLNYSIEDIDQNSIDQSEKDIISFVNLSGNLLNDIGDEQIGHDFWLTRNHHGAGFWDRGYNKPIGDKLTEISHSFSSCDLILNDTNKIIIC